jgi:predicted kinase
MKIIFLKGLPGSGKSTWTEEYKKLNPNTKSVNKDAIRNELHGGIWSRENEAEVKDYQYNQVATYLAE